jgi:hypothetical protein
MAKRARPKGVKYEEFLFWLGNSSIHYGFGFQRQAWNPDPYKENLILWATGDCLHPGRCKGRQAKVSFHADHSLVVEDRPLPQAIPAMPKAIGSIRVGKNRFEISGFLPPGACWSLAGAIANGTVTSMSTNGYWPTPGHGHLTSVSFNGPEFDPIAYVG